MEETPGSKVLSLEEQSCEDHFKKHFSRGTDAQFMVIIPFKSSPNTLGVSLTSAEKQFLNFEKKLVKKQHPEVLQSILNLELHPNFIDFDKGQISKTLGLMWAYNSDIFCYKISQFSDTHVTKRAMLSDISKIFDLLGLVSPSIIIAMIQFHLTLRNTGTNIGVN